MTEIKNVVVLGSSGSVGRQALDVIRAHPGRFRVLGLCVGSDSDALQRQAGEFGVARTGIGADAAAELAALEDADIVLNAIVGAAGLKASLAALAAGKILALANKESLVAGGELCLAAAAAGGGRVEAVDSEHAAIAQCLDGRDLRSVERIILTASGGPFRTRTSLDDVTPEEALKHPTWAMGPKITIDSATLMNKGLEVIEAHHLFGTPYDRIEVVVHPQSIVHGLVNLCDGATLAHLGHPDMRVPIAYALHYPERVEVPVPALDLAQVGALTFEAPDVDTFPCLELAIAAGRAGGTAPCVLNAANEVAVHAFLGGRLGFMGIPAVIEGTLEQLPARPVHSFDSLYDADADARGIAGELIGRMALA